MLRKSDYLMAVIYLLRKQECYNCVARDKCFQVGKTLVRTDNCAKEFVKFIKEER